MAIFLTKANRFAFCWLDSLLKIAWGTKTNYVIIGPVWRELSLELFIRAIRVLCKPYSYKWFLSRLM